MGNQMQSAFEKAGQAIGENLAENVTAAIDELEKQVEQITAIDDNTNSSDNVTDNSAEILTNGASEEPTEDVEKLRAIVEKQDANINRLIKIMGDMITNYGAHISDVSVQDENDPFGDKEPEEPAITLDSITLGSM